MKKTVDKIPFYRLGWNKILYYILFYFIELVGNVENRIIYRYMYRY
jgi:hypothetical protein